jgi:hypothetical protein
MFSAPEFAVAFRKRTGIWAVVSNYVARNNRGSGKKFSWRYTSEIRGHISCNIRKILTCKVVRK